MSVVAAIVRKDLRRLTLPIAIWLVCQGLALAWFAQAPGFLPDDPGTWRYGLGIWVQIIGTAQYLFGALLAGMLLLEDPLRGSDSFWRTRPIASGRLLLAKALSVIALLVLAPLLVHAAVWLGLGFLGSDLLQAAAQDLRFYSGCVLAGMAAACLSRTLAQHLFALLGIAGFQVGLQFAGMHFTPAWSVVFKGPDWLRELPVFTTTHLVPLAILVPAYLRIRQAAAVTVVALATLLAFTAPRVVAEVIAWQARAAVSVATASGSVSGVELRGLRGRPTESIPPIRRWESPAPRLEVRVDQSGPLETVVRPAGGAGALRWAGGPELSVLVDRAPDFPVPLLLETLERRRPSAVVWSLPVRRVGYGETRVGSGPADWNGRIDLETLRLREVGRLPVRSGAVIASGSNRVRLAAVQSPEDASRPFRLVIEEREAGVRDDDYLKPGHRVYLGRRAYKLDYFLLEIEGERHVLEVEDGEGVVYGNVLVASRRLVLPLRPWAQLERGVVVKLRYERAGEVQSVNLAARLPQAGEAQP